MSTSQPGDNCSVRHHVNEYRIVVVRHGKRSQRWRWAVEEKSVREWKLRETGFAWTRSGAREKALRNYERTTYIKVEREEMHVLCAWSYTPEEPVESPVPAELVV